MVIRAEKTDIHSLVFDGIQIEHNADLRTDSTLRKAYADSLAITIIEYMEKHYFVNFSMTNCTPNSINEWKESQLIISPNPSHNTVTIFTDVIIRNIIVFDLTGKQLMRVSHKNQVNVSSLVNGMYILQMEFENGSDTVFRRIVKD